MVFSPFSVDLAARFMTGPVRERGDFALLAARFVAGLIRRHGGFALPFFSAARSMAGWLGGMEVSHHLVLGCLFYG